MKLAVSDLGFTNLEEVSDHLIKNNIEYIEVVPPKTKPYSSLKKEDVLAYSKVILEKGLKPYSFLSLFYTLKVDSIKETIVLTDHIKKLVNYLSAINGKVLVFGSPGLRKKVPGWETYVTEMLSVTDSLLHGTDIQFIIEPVTSSYGAEFFITVDSVVEFIEKNKFKNIFTMIDTHNAKLEGQNPSAKFLQFQKYIKHVHVAEPGLGALSDINMHQEFAHTLRVAGYDKIITHEITKKEDFKDSVVTLGKIYK